MMLNDSIEFENHIFESVEGAELVKMKSWHEIKLSDIWIPSDLLLHRKYPVQTHVDQPIQYHKLEKVSFMVDCFSVYEDSQFDDVAFNSDELLLDSLEEISKDTQFSQSFSNSIPDLLEHLQITDSEQEDTDDETSKEIALEHSKQGTFHATDLKCDSDSENISSFRTVLGVESSNQDTSADSLYLSDNIDNCWNDAENNFNELSDETPSKLESAITDEQSNVCLLNDFESKDAIDEVINLPIVYQRPKDEFDNVSSDKRKQKRERKSKKQQPKSVPLESIFMTNEEVAKMNAEKFYDSLASKENNCSDSRILGPNDPRGIAIFPSFPKKIEIKFVHDVKVERSTHSSLDASNEVSDSVMEQKEVLPAKQVEAPVDFSEDTKEVVIENIPTSVDKEMLMTLLQSYGEIKHIDFRNSKKTSKAKVIINIENVDWLIEGLNESHPFGISPSGALKCYEKQ